MQRTVAWGLVSIDDSAATRVAEMKLYYACEAANRIGELSEQIYFLRNLHFERQHNLVLLTFPIHHLPRLNQAFFEIATRGIEVMTCEERELVMLGRKFDSSEGVSIEMPTGHEFVPCGPGKLKVAVTERYRGLPRPFCFRLNDQDLERGRELRSQFGIPSAAPIVTLHVREQGYLPDLTYHNHRDAQIETYQAAIEYLIEQGFWVVRVGDASMQPIKSPPQGLIDLPFHPANVDFAFPYFISQSAFFVGSASGPSGFAKSFHIPTLDLNWPIDSSMWGARNDLLVPKHHFSQQLGRRLTYEEILMSSLPECYHAEDYAAEGVVLQNNTPEEVLEAVREMLHRLRGDYREASELSVHEQHSRSIEAKAQRIRAAQPELRMPGWRPLLEDVPLSLSFAELNPEFLGHRWKNPLPCNVDFPKPSMKVHLGT